MKDAQVSLFRAIKPARSRATTSAASTTATATSTGVAPDSTTETYAALRLDIENWRWAGVPFYIRTGKRLPVTQTELRLVFKHPPKLGFPAFDRQIVPNQLVVKLDPSTGVRLIVEAHREDGPGPIELDMEFAAEGGEGPTPYEVLLHAAMVGDMLRFTRQDAVEETWRVMQPLLDSPGPVHTYAPGSWGPKEGEELVAGARSLARPMDRAMSKTAPSEGAAERCGAVAVHPDRGLRVPVQLPHGCARRARRRDRLALRATLRRAQRLREPARPRGGLVPLRAVRHQPSDRPALRARHECPRDDVEDAVRLGGRPRRPDDGADRSRGHDHPSHEAACGR